MLIDHTTHRFDPVIFYETPDVTQTAAQGNGTAPAGQGQSTGLDWGMFPHVPEEHRPLLEPTIREQIQPYVTRLEQQYAPFKQFEGVPPEDVNGLFQMAQDFEQNPVDVWLRMGQALFQSGQHLQDIDFDFLAQLASGQVPDEEDPMGGNGDGQLPPELAQILQPLQQQVQGLTQWQQQEAQREQERQRQQVEQRQQAAYVSAANTVKAQVKASGYPEDLLTDGAIRAAIIANGGSVQGAIKHFVDQRSGLLKGFVEQRPQPGRQPTVQGGGPPRPPERNRRGGNRNASFDDARDGAEQFLKRQQAADAQG